jgi:hypothetical protein
LAPHHPDFESLLDWAIEHHHRAKATARQEGLLDCIREFFEVSDETSQFEVSRFVVGSTKN